MIVIVMGVSGSGKTTVGSKLARELGWEFKDADDFHPPENVLKMSEGLALTDEDREPWLEDLTNSMKRWLARDKSVVLACSALKESYRQRFKKLGGKSIRLVYLKGSMEMIKQRLEKRSGHFMKTELLPSQFATLEEPDSADAIVADASLPVDQLVEGIKARLPQEKAARRRAKKLTTVTRRTVKTTTVETLLTMRRIDQNQALSHLLHHALLGQNRYLLGIVGAPGSGKSTFAEYLVTELNDEASGRTVLVPMDGYHMSNEELEELGILNLKGIPESFDGRGFVELIKRLKQEPDKTHLAPRFDRSIEASIPDAIAIRPEHKVVVVEGNYLLLEQEPWSELRAIFNEVWFIEASDEVILPRLLRRHKQGGKSMRQARVKVESTDMPNAKLIAGTKQRASALLVNLNL